MVRLLVCTMLTGCVVAAVAPQASAQAKKVEITQKWSGSVESEKVEQPVCITSARGMRSVWEAWKIKGDVPKVDFSKNIVVAVYSRGSKLSIAGGNLDDKGNLEVISLATSDLGPGLRYALGVVSREGVKTVNKRDLPRD